MGDRCSVTMWCKESDLARVCELVDDEADGDYGSVFSTKDVSDGIVRLEVEEANYGWYDELATLANAGIMFHGRHSNGDAYPAAAFVSHENDILMWSMVEDNLVVAVDWFGCILPDDQTVVTRFCELWRQVLAEFTQVQLEHQAASSDA